MFLNTQQRTALYCAIVLGAILLSPSAFASNLTLNGVFKTDDAVQFFDLTIAAPATVDLRSYGYAGGVTSTGQVVPSGGFDTILTLFTGSGILITENDEGAGAATDPATGLAADARINTPLNPGSYIVALTQYDNFANSTTLSGGFDEAGNPNFTADSSFSSASPCPGNMFRDISGTSGRCRTGNWTLDFLNVAAVTPRSPVPEPSAGGLLGMALAAVGLLFAFRKSKHRPRSRANRRKRNFSGLGRGSRVLCAAKFLRITQAALLRPKSLAPAMPLLAVLLSTAAFGQTGPSFATLDDILDGQRTLLRNQDLIVGYTENIGNQPHTLSNQNYLTKNGTISSTQNGAATCDATLDKTLTTFAGRLYNSDHDQYLNMCAAPSTGAHVLLTDGSNASSSPEFGSIGVSIFSGALADFTGSGYSQLAVNYSAGGQNGALLLISAANPDGSRSPALHFGNNGAAQPAETMLAMTAGDFNGDGKPEIAGLAYRDNGRPSIVIYTVNPQTLAVTKAAEVIPTYSGESGPITYYSMTSGKFTGADHQQIVLTYASAQGTAKLVAFDFAAGSSQPMEQKIADTNSPPGASPEVNIPSVIQVQAARFNWHAPYDQVVFLFSWQTSENHGSNTKYIKIYGLDPSDLSFQSKSSADFSEILCSSKLTIGNFDRKQTVNGEPQYDPSLQLAFLTGACLSSNQDINIFSVDPITFNFTANQPAYPVQLNAVNPDAFIVAGDLQGRSYLLGAPTKLTINSKIRPTVIAGMPPMHIDFIVPAGQDNSDKPVVFNFSAGPDGFNTSYQTSDGVKVDTANTNTISWSFGAKETVGGSAKVGIPNIGSLEVKDTFTAAQELKGSVETQHGGFQQQTYSKNSTTGYGDFVMFNQTTFTTWIYPVIGKTICPAAKPQCNTSEALPMTIQFSGPETKQISSVGSAVSWYQPPWEPGNIFSYPANLAQLQLIYPNLQLLSKNSDQWFTDSSKDVEQTTWNAGSSTGTKSTLDTTFSFENDLSVEASFGVKGLDGATANYGFDISASSGLSTLNQATTDVNQSTGIGVTKSGGVADPNLYQYGITSYLIGRTKPGGLVDNVPLSNDVQTFDFLQAAFVADPLDPGAGAWWQQNYLDVPDVALNHPARWTITTPGLSNPVPPECVPTGTGASQMDCAAKELDNPANPWGSPFYYMRGLFISNASAPGQGPTLTQTTAGTELSVQARVYNYSFASMPDGSKVHVRFYAQPWDQRRNVALLDPVTHQPIDSLLLGEDILNPIPPFADSPGAPLNWVYAHTFFDTTGHDDQYFTFWVVAWIQDSNGNLVPETGHHCLTAIPGTLTSFKQVQTEDYSNNLGFWKQSFYVARPNANVPVGVGAEPARLDISKIELSSNAVGPGQPISVTALVSAEGQSASNVTALFFDHDPNDPDSNAFSLEMPPYIAAGDAHQVSAIYRPKACGTRQIFITVAQGTSEEIVRRSSPVQVSCVAARNR